MEETQSFNVSYNVSFIGDSDIARWPQSLLPVFPHNDKLKINLLGQDGATFTDTIRMIKNFIQNPSKSNVSKGFIVIACVGENDLVNGQSIDKILSSFDEFIKLILHWSSLSSISDALQECRKFPTCICFLGPKLEPWHKNDPFHRKKFANLSRKMKGQIQMYDAMYPNENIIFVDCLTMFCGKSAKLPGAIFGGKAIAESKYFQNDEVHLNELGYTVWKNHIESEIFHRYE